MKPQPDAPIPDDLPVVLVFDGDGVGLWGPMELTRLQVILEEEVDYGELDGDPDYEIHEMECQVREAPASTEGDNATGKLLCRLDLQVEGGIPGYPEFEGTGVLVVEKMHYDLVLNGYTFGDARKMVLTPQGLRIRNDFFDPFAFLKNHDGYTDYYPPRYYLDGKKYVPGKSDEEDLFVLKIFIENHSCILRSAPNHNFLSIEEVFAREPDWRPAVYGLIASMPSERREHIFCCPFELEDSLEDALSRGFISEIAP